MTDRRLIRVLDAKTYSASAALTVVGLPPQRVREWVKRGLFETLDAHSREPGKRRAWHLLDVLAARLFGALTDDETGLALSLPAARDILRSALYERDLGRALDREETLRAVVREGRNPREYNTADVLATPENLALATERAFEARWLIAARVRYVEPDIITFWRGRLSAFERLHDALLEPFPNPRGEPLRMIVLEVKPHIDHVLETLVELREDA
jgi:hypothetical protein